LRHASLYNVASAAALASVLPPSSSSSASAPRRIISRPSRSFNRSISRLAVVNARVDAASSLSDARSRRAKKVPASLAAIVISSTPASSASTHARRTPASATVNIFIHVSASTGDAEDGRASVERTNRRTARETSSASRAGESASRSGMPRPHSAVAETRDEVRGNSVRRRARSTVANDGRAPRRDDEKAEDWGTGNGVWTHSLTSHDSSSLKYHDEDASV